MLARGEEPERRPFMPWHIVRQALARVRLQRWLRWPRRDDLRVPPPLLKLWERLPPAPAWLAAFFTWFVKTHNRNMQIIAGWIADILPKGLYARGFFNRRACLAPWLHAFFAWDGATYLCCMTNGRMESLGNVGRQSVREVFHGEGFARVRASFLAGRHLSTCHRCDLFLGENARLHDALGRHRSGPEPEGEDLPTAPLALSSPA